MSNDLRDWAEQAARLLGQYVPDPVKQPGLVEWRTKLLARFPNKCAECGARVVVPYTKAGFGSKQWCSVECARWQ